MKILVRGANWIGDAVMSIPALRLLRQKFPQSRITLHTRPWAEGVFRDSHFVDEIICIEPARTRVANVLAQARELKRHAFDAAYLFPNSFESALVVKLAGVPRRFGYATEKRGIFLTDAIPVPEWKSRRHESQYYLNLIGETPTANVTAPLLEVSDERRSGAMKLLTSLGVGPQHPVVALGPGSTNSTAKRWPAASFAKLADMLRNKAGVEVLLLGSSNESDVAAEVISTAASDLINLAGKTDLATATAVLSSVDLFVSNDMGLAHIAAAVGTPTVVIFGPTNDTTTRPLGPFVEIVREPVECSPCMLRECPIDHRCMTRIHPERVFRTAAKMLELHLTT